MRMLHLVKIRQYSVATGCLDEKFGFPAKSKRRLHQYKPDRDTSKQITGSIPPIHNSGSTGAHLLSITVDELMQLGLVALGTQAPSLIIRGANILALHTGELLGRDIVIKGRHVAAITPWNHFLDAEKVIKATGKFVSPVFIDAHIHMEYTNLISGELERLSVPRGTTTVLANANCIVNVFGERGMDFMAPLRIFRQVSHKIPGNSPEVELGGTSVPTAELCERVSRSSAATLRESNPFSLDIASAQKQAAALYAGKCITGHSALLVNEPFGSMNLNIESVVSVIPLLKDGLGHVSFCVDDKLAEDLDSEGHIDHQVRRAISLGLIIYRLDHLIGSITPGKLADLLILDNLEDARPSAVVVNGVIMAECNQPLFKNSNKVPEFTLNKPKKGRKQAWVQAMEMYDGYFKRTFHTLLPMSSSGSIEGNTSRDVLKVVVIDRHTMVLQDDMEEESVLNTKQRLPVRVCCRCPSHTHEVHKMSATITQEGLPSSLCIENGR
ncbi:hypothetical protein BKA61DRAFT_674271 [Leptodontidium sp. MPI-SDFR-AT-0119]|nr:hypothetical protein BKA61DRAFT_674271 [Leptodontidium sp. MPI-SDFR-AT-0119]